MYFNFLYHFISLLLLSNYDNEIFMTILDNSKDLLMKSWICVILTWHIFFSISSSCLTGNWSSESCSQILQCNTYCLVRGHFLLFELSVKKTNVLHGNINSFQPSVVFHIETSHFICCTIQKTGFYVRCNTGLNGLILIPKYFASPIIYNTHCTKNEVFH